jgi:2-haloacid dehalogenase
VKYKDFKVLTFDCYGTLIDWLPGILSVLRPWATRNALSAADDELLQAYDAAETACEHELAPALYPQILRAAHARIAANFGVAANANDADSLAESVGDWLPFPDTVAALQQLKQWHKLVVVSNVDKKSFARTREKLGIEFDAVITAEEVGVYKPDLRMFRRALEVIGKWGIRPTEVLHVANSLFHDHAPAKTIGLKTVWVDRQDNMPSTGTSPRRTLDIMPDVVVSTLMDFVELEMQERRGG